MMEEGPLEGDEAGYLCDQNPKKIPCQTNKDLPHQYKYR